MKFYAYQGDYELGAEPLGTEGKLLFCLQTVRGAHNRVRRAWGRKPYRLYTYGDFFDNDTFKRV